MMLGTRVSRGKEKLRPHLEETAGDEVGRF